MKKAGLNNQAGLFYLPQSELKDWLARGRISERYALPALRVELRGPHQVHIVECTRFVCATRENVVKPVAS